MLKAEQTVPQGGPKKFMGERKREGELLYRDHRGGKKKRGGKEQEMAGEEPRKTLGTSKRRGRRGDSVLFTKASDANLRGGGAEEKEKEKKGGNSLKPSNKKKEG